MKIGVFDSGIGGKSIANFLEKNLPNHQIIFKNDHENVPYGSKTTEEISQLAFPIIQSMIDDRCSLIVIACNTVSVLLSKELRDKFAVPFVVLDPMIKPATEITNSNIITVCATPATLSSKRYQDLKDHFAKDIKVIEPDCSDWAYLIDNNTINQQIIDSKIRPSIDAGSDVLVLACTHYHWIEEDIKSLVKGQATVIQPEKAILEQTKRVISQLG